MRRHSLLQATRCQATQPCDAAVAHVAHEIKYRFCGPLTYCFLAISRTFSRDLSKAPSTDRSSEPTSGCRFLSIASSTMKVISRESSYPQKHTQCREAS
ncbi:hypothetical protein OI25_4720 [Paraburkholderia fungorum]|uniref:Uncharacterized protein n=1 Tax=Paraburkholderia fungorum TaxID=134537 RepID=A0AAU8TCU8_9BURK|nr:hypothetical protein OI25_4720 [Paraburkholderia fungorum]